MRSVASIASISLLVATIAARPIAAASTPVASTSLAIRNRSDPAGSQTNPPIAWAVCAGD